jgi:hypothetical protein
VVFVPPFPEMISNPGEEFDNYGTLLDFCVFWGAPFGKAIVIAVPWMFACFWVSTRPDRGWESRGMESEESENLQYQGMIFGL